MHTLLYIKSLLQSNLQGSSVDDVLDLQHYVVTPPSAIHFFSRKYFTIMATYGVKTRAATTWTEKRMNMS